MTEKRFEYTEYIDDDDCLNSYALITDNSTTEVYSDSFMSLKRLTILLNELSEENKNLNISLSAHMVDLSNCKGKCSALMEENEELKTELKALRKKYNDYSDAVNKRLQEMFK